MKLKVPRAKIIGSRRSKFFILALKDEVAAIPPSIVNLEDFQREIGHIECTEKIAKTRLLHRNRSDDHPTKIRSRITAYFDREKDLLDKISK